MTPALLLLVIGIGLSAFFSGSETGFYRVTRVRLVIDALQGDRISKWLLHLANNPAFFVATTLVGNNLANYLTSLAVVLLTKHISQSDAVVAELTATILFSPLVFIYGELLPKYLFYRAPNRLLRAGGLPFLFFSVVFAPISALLWMLGRVLQTLLGETPLQVQPKLARTELQQVLEEGHEVGILRPAQRRLAQNLFVGAGLSVRRLCRPVAKLNTVAGTATREQLLQRADRWGATLLIVHGDNREDLVGYYRVIELQLANGDAAPQLRPLIRLSPATTLLDAIQQLRAEDQDAAVVPDRDGRTVSVLFVDDLVDSLMGTGT
jgi:CBS domain containing-hemolysin-like protein